MFDTDNSEACTVNGDSIRGQFPYDSNGRIILDVSMIPTCFVCMTSGYHESMDFLQASSTG